MSKENSARYSTFLLRVCVEFIIFAFSYLTFISPLMIRILCLGISHTWEDDSLSKMVMYVLSVALVR